MTDESERVLHALLLPELAAVAVAFVVVSDSLFGGGRLLASVPRAVRLVAWAVLGSEFLVPAAVYLDMRRRGAVDAVWVHAAALPVVNVFGVAAYLERRGRGANPVDADGCDS